MISDFDGLRFVVARYNEDIDWVPSLVARFPGSKCTVYNKGRRDIETTSSYEVTPLDNVGRESHTYLSHIISVFHDAQDEVTVFLQGHPFDHCQGFTLPDLVESSVLKISGGSPFENIGTRVIRIENGIPTYHMSIKEELTETYQELTGKDLPRSFQFSAGGMFVTSRSIISKRPIEFYQKAIKMVDSESNPIRGFCFERIWSLIFA